MPRQARRISPTGIYHVMLRGINRQRIFEDDQDEQKFLELLEKYKKRCGFAVYGYCLMGNHVHLLIKEAAHPSVMTIQGMDMEVGPGESLEMVFKRIGVSYVLYFNRKYKRTVHLFQDRFRSEAIATDEYMLMSLRYIHMNPVKAGLCAKPEEYLQSSYREYLTESARRMIESEPILNMITTEDLKAYTERPNEDRFMEMRDREERPKTDEEAIACLQMISGCASSADFQKLGKAERDGIFRKLRTEGINVSQMSRITGCSRTIIYRAMNE